MKRIKKAFTLIELVTTLAVGSILLATLSTFLIFTSRISSDYKESLNTSHNAYLMETTIKSYIETFKEGIRVTPFDYDSSKVTGQEQIILDGEAQDSSHFTIKYIYPNGETYPKLQLQFAELMPDNIFSAKSLLKLSIKETESASYLDNKKYVFTITYTYKAQDYDLNFTYFL